MVASSRTMAAGILCCRRALRPDRQSCRHPVGGAAAHRAYPERIGQGGAALVSGADEAGTARAAAGRLSGRQHLAHMMLVQALRLHLAEGLNGGVGWLFALADKQMSAAISAMHDDPAHRWTLQEAGGARRHVAIDLRPEIQGDGWDVADGIPDALANAAGRGPAGEFQRSHFRDCHCRSATNPKAPSAQPSRGSWAARHGNIAVAALRLPLHSKLSQCDMRCLAGFAI
jgi:hypothetical protein